MRTIPSYDLQTVPANYGTEDYDFFSEPIVITHKIFASGNTLLVTINGDVPSDQLDELRGRLNDALQEFCNEISEEIAADFYGF